MSVHDVIDAMREKAERSHKWIWNAVVPGYRRFSPFPISAPAGASVRLKDLNAEFVCAKDGQDLQHQWDAEGFTPQGILMDCPCDQGHMLLVWFDRGLNGGPPAHPDALPKYRWRVSGSSLEDLTLEPSINAGCWHGFFRNGEVTVA